MGYDEAGRPDADPAGRRLVHARLHGRAAGHAVAAARRAHARRGPQRRGHQRRHRRLLDRPGSALADEGGRQVLARRRRPADVRERHLLERPGILSALPEAQAARRPAAAGHAQGRRRRCPIPGQEPWLERNSALGNLLGGIVAAPQVPMLPRVRGRCRPSGRSRVRDVESDGWAETKAALRAFRAVAEDIGAKPLVLVIPEKAQVDPRRAPGDRRRDRRSRLRPRPSLPRHGRGGQGRRADRRRAAGRDGRGVGQRRAPAVLLARLAHQRGRQPRAGEGDRGGARVAAVPRSAAARGAAPVAAGELRPRQPPVAQPRHRAGDLAGPRHACTRGASPRRVRSGATPRWPA